MKVLKVLFLSSYNYSTNINKSYQTEISRKWFSVWKGFLRTFLYLFLHELGDLMYILPYPNVHLTLKSILMICINVKIQHLLTLILNYNVLFYTFFFGCCWIDFSDCILTAFLCTFLNHIFYSDLFFSYIMMYLSFLLWMSTLFNLYLRMLWRYDIHQS